MRNLERLRSGDEVLAFMAESLVFGPGSYEGQAWRPAEWQAEFIRAVYDPRRSDGSRLIDRALLLTAKGNGKTELAGALAVVELVLRDSADVTIAAATWAQAALLKASADGCCSHPNSALSGLVEVTEAEIRLRGTTSRVIRVASDAGSNDGARPTALIRDEIHEWNTPQRERNYQVLGGGLAKRGGLALDISTVGADRDTLLGRLDTYCRRVQAGELEDARLVYRYHGAEGQLSGLNLADDDDLRAAIRIANPSAQGDDPIVDVDEVARRFREMPPGAAKRYFLNIWGQGGDEQWLPEGAWAKLADVERTVAKGATVFAGFDGSNTADSTALVVLAVEDDRKPHVFVAGVWERPDHAPDGWVVPRGEVNAAVEALFSDYDVRQLRADPFLWRDELADWMNRWPGRVELFPTNASEKWGESCELTYAAVVNGEVSHDGDPVLDRHLKNAVPRTSNLHKWTTFGKLHPASKRRVDAAVALTLAIHARGTFVSALEPFVIVG